MIGQAAELTMPEPRPARHLRKSDRDHTGNSNGHIMTDTNMETKIYRAIDSEIIEKIIINEKPDSILPTLGGRPA